jgi:hypothetical protein
MSKDSRRHRRVPYIGPIRLVWEDNGQSRFVQGKCIDVSESGLRVESAVPIPLRSRISLNAEKIKMSGSATVKHVERFGAKYILGLELSQALHDKALAAIREPWALRTPSTVV